MDEFPECRLCHAEHALQTLINYGARPITKRLLTRPGEPEYLHPVVLNLCGECGFVQISDVIPEHELYSNYELPSAWKPQPHLLDEADYLLQSGELTAGTFVVELGCNDGNALDVIRQRGVERMLGIEPSADVAAAARRAGFDVLNEFFTAELAREIRRDRGRADLVLSRQVLEHISYLDSFMEGVGELLKEDDLLMLEVPDFAVPLAYGDPSAIWEEHVNHFTEATLGHLLARFGYRICKTTRYDFSGGALCVFARRTGASLPSRASMDKQVAEARTYPARVHQYRSAMIERADSELAQGGKIAIYGAGNRTVILLNYFLKDYVTLVVDDQPEKQNRFLPLCHLPIKPSSEMIASGVTLCLLAVNAENEDKVIGKSTAFVESGGRFLSILSPSKRLIRRESRTK